MNSLSSIASMLGRGGINTNSITYINGFAKNISTDFSGGAYTDLSNTSTYTITSSGINPTDNNTTFARLKYNDNYLKITDFNSTGSFTIYLKHAARYSSLPPLNFQYPNVIQLNPSGPISVSEILTVNFYSSLYPGTVVPYSISNLNSIASQTGSFTSPFMTITYTITTGAESTVTFNVSGGLSANISIV
jgi:hypothetical protein